MRGLIVCFVIDKSMKINGGVNKNLGEKIKYVKEVSKRDNQSNECFGNVSLKKFNIFRELRLIVCFTES